MPASAIHEMAARFHFQPEHGALFLEAATHSSYANEHHIASNERLEFLGDSVLSIIVCRYLLFRFPKHNEGQLAKLKAIIVSANVLAQFSLDLNLDRFLLLGEGERRSNGRAKVNILADLFEAFLGAYYLTFGLEKTIELIMPLIEAVTPEIIRKYEAIDAKTTLQEFTQARGFKPLYRLIQEEGPAHEKTFTVELLLNETVIGTGRGRSIKEAENHAAQAGIQYLKQQWD
ncbi:RNAse III [Hydrogenispora ethanolica]|uniref:Ribonuclease 3 n=2 Tax=Hydrogenispora ethanolica TaxID=1082276 RepID=A0A4R1QZ88_HYDET|nr:RNAse III [Hydrogenispora ethanolica]